MSFNLKFFDVVSEDTRYLVVNMKIAVVFLAFFLSTIPAGALYLTEAWQGLSYEELDDALIANQVMIPHDIKQKLWRFYQGEERDITENRFVISDEALFDRELGYRGSPWERNGVTTYYRPPTFLAQPGNFWLSTWFRRQGTFNYYLSSPYDGTFAWTRHNNQQPNVMCVRKLDEKTRDILVKRYPFVSKRK